MRRKFGHGSTLDRRSCSHLRSSAADRGVKQRHGMPSIAALTSRTAKIETGRTSHPSRDGRTTGCRCVHMATVALAGRTLYLPAGFPSGEAARSRAFCLLAGGSRRNAEPEFVRDPLLPGARVLDSGTASLSRCATSIRFGRMKHMVRVGYWCGLNADTVPGRQAYSLRDEDAKPPVRRSVKTQDSGVAEDADSAASPFNFRSSDLHIP